MKRSASIAALLLCGAAALGGCKPRYDGIQIRFLFGEGNHAGDRLEVEEGQAVLVQVEPLSSNPFEDYEAFDLVDLESFNESILLAAPTTEPDEFVLAGAALGETVIRISINGEQVDEIDAEVTEQFVP